MVVEEQGDSEAQPEEPAEPAKKVAEKKTASKKEEEKKQEDEEEKEEPIVPAGPQVVPKPAQLKGPRVIRVEQPDYAPRPQPRQFTPGQFPPYGGGRGGSLSDERSRVESTSDDTSRGRGKKDYSKTSKRSPRRKGGVRGGDVSEKLKEWRNADMAERAERIAGAGGGQRRRRYAPGPGGKSTITGGGAKSGKVDIEEPITVKKSICYNRY